MSTSHVPSVRLAPIDHGNGSTASSFDIRPATPDEMPQLAAIGGYVYGGSFGDGDDSLMATAIRPEWTLCAFDGDRMATSYATIPFTMRAHGRAVDLGGVSVVGTLPEYRRRGLVRRLTVESFQQLYEQGRPLAALWASQAAIYRRYGYAHGAPARTYAIDSVDVVLRPPTGLGPGASDGHIEDGDVPVRRLGVEDGYPQAKDVYARYVADRMCYLHRARALWDTNALQAVEADGPVHIAVAGDASGPARGYVVYTLRANRVDHASRGQELVIRDLAWLDLGAYRALWAWLARHDLVGRIRWDRAPADDPAPQILSEPRLLHTRDTEGIWVRVVDVAGALTARGYRGSGELTLEIPDDDVAPWNPGTYALTVVDGDATVAGRPGPGALRLTVEALSLLYTGTHTAATLRRWGMAEGDDRAVAAADALFALDTAPGCPDHF